ncbi:hypothetical protein CDD82_386 [Ophiocordyceps australis]|uniref:Uncharacterized protein n=1 Tax=Ophiocordyceps australis TaxID=1399860 RepID=A0A2C5ZHZ0_9HYPO|nr:hypothetical protein CDD82_386 [Ophiocordyceps australis]
MARKASHERRQQQNEHDWTRLAPLSRQAVKNNVASPIDSGYGSGEASPSPRPRQARALDGTASCDEPEATPKAKRRQQGDVEDRHVWSESRRRNSGSARMLNRFVPFWDPSATTTERYQTAKQTRALSPTERLVRHGAVSVDPFSPRRRPANIQASDTTALLSWNGTRRRRQQYQAGVDDGHGHLLRRGTNARLFTMSSLAASPSAQDELENYHDRVASALDIDRVRRILSFSLRLPKPPCLEVPQESIQKTGDSRQWSWPKAQQGAESPRPSESRTLPYCSILAYSATCQILAVGLGNVLYTWSEGMGVRTINGTQTAAVWLTCIAFSSPQGNKNILAAGRSDGSLVLKTVDDGLGRFVLRHGCSVTCLSWRPRCVLRPSRNPLNPDVVVQTEHLVVGDELGNLYYYNVEWPMNWEISRDTWPGCIVLVAKLSLHCQQICGLAWSPDGSLLASGGNDNLCCLFDIDETVDLLPELEGLVVTESGAVTVMGHGSPVWDNVHTLGPGCELQVWVHGAAVKAMAFCPWRDGLVATGGGSNDKCIHFFHASTGSALATIAVAAQVTSLIWSTTRREIAATFGYAQPEHPYRVAVFSWPDCCQVAAIPWDTDLRALYAIPYPWTSGQTKGCFDADGCIVVASSDETVKFHQVWSAQPRKVAVAGSGLLGGSDILEDLEGVIKEGDVIR